MFNSFNVLFALIIISMPREIITAQTPAPVKAFAKLVLLFGENAWNIATCKVKTEKIALARLIFLIVWIYRLSCFLALKIFIIDNVKL